MLYDPEKIRAYCTNGNLDDPAYCQVLLSAAFPEERDRMRHKFTFLEMLKCMPDANQQRRIIEKLTEVTAQARSKICAFRWWDIVPSQRNLVAVIRRNDRVVHAQFFWRARRAGISAQNATRASWIPSPNDNERTALLASLHAEPFCLD